MLMGVVLDVGVPVEHQNRALVTVVKENLEPKIFQFEVDFLGLAHNTGILSRIQGYH